MAARSWDDEKSIRSFARWFTGPNALGGTLLLTLSTLLGCAEDDAERGHRPNVLLVTIDTLRADHLGCYGHAPYGEPVSPNIDRLASEGVRFDQCFAPRGQTLPSLASMMSGMFPSAHGIRDNGQAFSGSPVTLAEILDGVGYETTAIFSVLPAWQPGRESLGPARGFADVECAQLAVMSGAESARPHYNDWDQWVARRGRSFLEARGDDDRPFFLWLHFYSVHRPYAPPRADHRRFVGDYDGPLIPASGAPIAERARLDLFLVEKTLNDEAPSAEDHRYALSQYDGGVRAADRMIGSVLDALGGSAVADDTLVVFTSDHGEELGDHQNYYFHGNSVYDGTLRLPMVLCWPGELSPRVVPDLAQNVDLLPTILDLIGEGARSLPGVEGLSLADAAREGSASPREAVFFEWQDLIYGVRTRDWKYLNNPLGAQPRKSPFNLSDQASFMIADEELYHVAEDAAEQVNLGGDQLHEERRASLRALAQRHWDRPARIRGWHTVDDEETLAQLQALGYVGPMPGRPDVYLRGSTTEGGGAGGGARRESGDGGARDG